MFRQTPHTTARSTEGLLFKSAGPAFLAGPGRAGRAKPQCSEVKYEASSTVWMHAGRCMERADAKTVGG